MIEVANLTKVFGPKLAVDNLSFTVGKGEVLGFLGPNGAGKSTTMRMITGYFPPTSGSVSVGGHAMDLEPVKAKAMIGYLPENAPLYSDLSVTGFLKYCAQLRGIKGPDQKAAIDRVVEICSLQRVARQSLDTLSKGYKHRTCLAQSLIHDPEILILDEPTDGLDPNQKHEVRQLIKRMGQNKAIIFSTHILEEVEAACSRAIIIDQGRVVADGTPDDLRRRASRAGSILVKISGLASGGLQKELAKLPGCQRLDVLSEGDDSLSAWIAPRHKTASRELAAQIYDLCVSRSLKLEELHEEPGRLDEMFREITAQVKY